MTTLNQKAERRIMKLMMSEWVKKGEVEKQHVGTGDEVGERAEEVPAEEGDERAKRAAQNDPMKIKKITAETNELLIGLQSKPGVLGIIVANRDGVPIRDTFSQPKRQFVYNLAAYMHQFRHKCSYALAVLYGDKARCFFLNYNLSSLCGSLPRGSPLSPPPVLLLPLFCLREL